MRDRFHVALASAALCCIVACGRSQANIEGPVTSATAQPAPAAMGGTGAAAGSTAASTARPTASNVAGAASAGRGATTVATAAPAAAAAGSTAPNAPAANAGASSGAGSAAPAGPATTAMQEPPAVACDAKDRTAEPKPVTATNMGSPASGPFKVTIQTDPGLTTHTIYRPEFGEKKLPVIVWGNGGCIKDGLSFSEFLTELASHGFLIVADGIPNGQGGGDITTDGTALIQGLDWAYKENDRPCSPYYRKLDTTKSAAMGQSCGGLMTLGASSDPRLTTAVIWNSGLFERDQKIYDGLHTPIAYFIGGEEDIAYAQAEADFAAIMNEYPFFYGNLPVGHVATYFEDNGGEFGRVGVAWLKWHLLGDESPMAKGLFVGKDCGLCKTDWVIEKKNME